MTIGTEWLNLKKGFGMGDLAHESVGVWSLGRYRGADEAARRSVRRPGPLLRRVAAIISSVLSIIDLGTESLERR